MINMFGAALTICRRRAHIRHMHFLHTAIWVAGTGYSYLATATATGSITDSTTQDDIPEKASELKVSEVHIWAKETVSRV